MEREWIENSWELECQHFNVYVIHANKTSGYKLMPGHKASLSFYRQRRYQLEPLGLFSGLPFTIYWLGVLGQMP